MKKLNSRNLKCHHRWTFIFRLANTATAANTAIAPIAAIAANTAIAAKAAAARLIHFWIKIFRNQGELQIWTFSRNVNLFASCTTLCWTSSIVCGAAVLHCCTAALLAWCLKITFDWQVKTFYSNLGFEPDPSGLLLHFFYCTFWRLIFYGVSRALWSSGWSARFWSQSPWVQILGEVKLFFSFANFFFFFLSIIHSPLWALSLLSLSSECSTCYRGGKKRGITGKSLQRHRWGEHRYKRNMLERGG